MSDGKGKLGGWGVCLWTVMGIALAGCGAPNKANIELRKQNQQLQNQVRELRQTHEADVASMQALQSKGGVKPALPEQRLEKLFTVHGLRLGRLTGGYQARPDQKWDDGLKVYAVPTDGSGQDLKAAGTIAVEAFDLSLSGDQRIGKWTFDVDQAKNNWQGGVLYMYVLECPWQTKPQHRQLTIKVSFTDELTGRVVMAEKVVEVNVPG